MKKVKRQKDSWGQYVIYVSKCQKYEYENPEIPKNPILDLHNQNIDKIYDILDVVENYFYDSGK